MSETSTRADLSESNVDNPQSAAGRSKFRLVILPVIAIVAVVWYRSSIDRIPPGISEADYRRAEQKFLSLYGTSPEPVETLMTLAELATEEERLDLAIHSFDQIPSEHPKYGPAARLQQGQLLAQTGRAVEAEAQLREYLLLTDESTSPIRKHRAGARQWLHYLLSAQLRFEDRKSLLEEGHRRKECGIKDSHLLYFPHLLVWNTASAWVPLRQYLERDPGNPDFQIAHARYLTGEGRLDEARALLEDLVAARPQDLNARAALLECLHALADEKALADTLRRAPEYTSEEPWLMTRMRGEAALTANRWEDAVRYFQKVLESDPTNPECTMGLARAYGALGRKTEQAAILKRSLVLADIRVFLSRVNENAPHEIRALADKCERIGLEDAADTYRRHADRIESSSANFEEGRSFP
jgi:predicted Zn-dependent protease